MGGILTGFASWLVGWIVSAVNAGWQVLWDNVFGPACAAVLAYLPASMVGYWPYVQDAFNWADHWVPVTEYCQCSTVFWSLWTLHIVFKTAQRFAPFGILGQA